MALELPRSCITDSACFNSSSLFIVRYRQNNQITFAILLNSAVSIIRSRNKVAGTHLLSVKAGCYTAVLRIGLVDFRIGVEQTLHGAVTVKRGDVEQHLPRVEREKERTRRRRRDMSDTVK